MNVLDFEEFKAHKNRAEKIAKLKELLLALKQAYVHLHPYLKYPIIYKLVEELMKTRVSVRQTIEFMEKQVEESNEDVHRN